MFDLRQCLTTLVLGQMANATLIAILGRIPARLAAMLLRLPYPLPIGLITFLVGLAPVIEPNLLAFPMFFVRLTQSLPVGLSIYGPIGAALGGA